MSFIAADPYARFGQVVDNGHCMRHVQVCAAVTHSSTLRRGEKVRGNDIMPGTVIGTFDANGRYTNSVDGSSHVAIFVEYMPNGIKVVDQWVGRPVQERIIRYKGGADKAVNDGDAYYVVEEA